MAKKKYQTKKHTFKHANVAPAVSDAATSSSVPEASRPFTASRAATVDTRDFAYVTADLRRIFVIGGSLVVAELVLWFLFSHTSLGSNVYSLIHL